MRQCVAGRLGARISRAESALSIEGAYAADLNDILLMNTGYPFHPEEIGVNCGELKIAQEDSVRRVQKLLQQGELQCVCGYQHAAKIRDAHKEPLVPPELAVKQAVQRSQVLDVTQIVGTQQLL